MSFLQWVLFFIMKEKNYKWLHENTPHSMIHVLPSLLERWHCHSNLFQSFRFYTLLPAVNHPCRYAARSIWYIWADLHLSPIFAWNLRNFGIFANETFLINVKVRSLSLSPAFLPHLLLLSIWISMRSHVRFFHARFYAQLFSPYLDIVISKYLISCLVIYYFHDS